MIFPPGSLSAGCLRAEVLMNELYYENGVQLRHLTDNVRVAFLSVTMARVGIQRWQERVAKKIAELGEPGDE